MLYLKVPGAALGPYQAPVSHPRLLALPPTLGVFLAPGANPDFLATFLSLHLCPLLPLLLMTSPSFQVHPPPGLGTSNRTFCSSDTITWHDDYRPF